MLGDIVQAERRGLGDQEPEDAVAPREVSHRLIDVGPGAEGEEPRELAAPLI
jgi:hypothetical protein